jgi:cytochrome c oxidase cbb3-type subunit 4
MTYSTLASFAQTWGLVLFVAFFLGVIVYAVWPGNRSRFNRAAHMPLDDSERPLDPRTEEPSDGRH